jgi:hypothetical protein
MNQPVTKRSDGKVLYGGRWRTWEQIEKLKAAARKSSKQKQQRRAENRKRKAEQIQASLPADGQNLNGAETVRMKSIKDKVEWVLAHLEYKHCPSGADEATRVIWVAAKKDQPRFMNKYLPMLLKQEEKEPERDLEAERQGKAYGKLTQELLARAKIKLCPTCDGKGWRDIDFKSPKEVGPWFQKFCEGDGI